MADDLETVLKQAPLSQAQRADLWDLYQGAQTSDDLAAKLKAMNIPAPVKAQLWDLKKGADTITQSGPPTAPNLQAQGGDTINGRDPNVAPSVVNRVSSLLRPMAQPQSGLDLIGVGGLSSAPIAESIAPKIVGPIIEQLGRGASAIGSALKRPLTYGGIGDMIYRGDILKGAGIAAAPYAADAIGQGAQAAGRFLQRETPLLKFEAPAVNLARPAAPMATAAAPAASAAAPVAQTVAKAPAVLPIPSGASGIDAIAGASQSSATAARYPSITPTMPAASAIPVAEAAAKAPVKPILNAAEMKEYLRLTRAGKSHADAMELIDAQREMVKRLNLPESETVRQRVQDRNASGRWQ